MDLLKSGEIGELFEGRAGWSSSNGPVSGHNGWLASRKRSGDWMVEQAVHVWDLARWVMGEPPIEVFGTGRRDVFKTLQPQRDVTDYYSTILKWRSGFHLSFVHSWVDPADDAFTGVWQRFVGNEGGVDFSSGAVTFRDRAKPSAVCTQGSFPTRNSALEAFVNSVRGGWWLLRVDRAAGRGQGRDFDRHTCAQGRRRTTDCVVGRDVER